MCVSVGKCMCSLYFGLTILHYSSSHDHKMLTIKKMLYENESHSQVLYHLSRLTFVNSIL